MHTNQVSEILLLLCLPSNLAKFPFQTMDSSPWGSKSTQKIIQVEVDVKCMHTKFGRCGLFSFGDFSPFKFLAKLVHRGQI